MHDELGRVDPGKAAEPSKPRGSANAKRPARLSDEHTSKRSKELAEPTDNTVASPSMFQSGSFDHSLIDPALTAENDMPIDPSLANIGNLMAPAFDAMQFSTQALAQNDSGDKDALPYLPPETKETAEEIAIDPMLDQLIEDVTPGEAYVKAEQNFIDKDRSTSLQSAPSLASLSPKTDQHEPPATEMSPPVINGNHPRTSIESNTESVDPSFYTPMSASRQSSRQPKAVDRYVPENARISPKVIKTDRRASSSVGSSGPTAPSTSSDAKSRRSSSNTSRNTHQIAATGQVDGNGIVKMGSRASSLRHGSRGSGMGESDLDPDEAFARALQVQEHGLRRRASGRA